MTRKPWENPVVEWIDYRMPIFTFLRHETVDYPTPKNLSYFWNFGSLAGIALVIMILSGIFMAMNYVPNSTMAFESVERIVRDVNYGWLLRFIHMNGSSMFFIVVYIHFFRGLYFGSYKSPRQLLWILGVIIIILMDATAFMGYVLPWGQMSFWGATVITNLFSAIPVVGKHIVTLLWGGFSVGNPTLNRFFPLHYLLPFILFAIIFLHLWALHTHGSNNPLGVDVKSDGDCIPFHPYYTVKDAFGVCVFLTFFSYFVFFQPDFFGSPDNYIKANPMATPAEIVPEWYLLPFYAILRSITFNLWFIPAKLIGVLSMFAALIVLVFVPWLDSCKVRSARFRPIYKQFYWIFAIDTVVLGYVGAHPPAEPLITIGQVGTAYYFAHFLIIMPLLGKFEKTRPLPESISKAVLEKSAPAKEVS